MRKFANFSWKGCEIIPPANWAGFERIMYSSGTKFASLVLIKFFEFVKVTNINSKHLTKCLKICRVSILKIAADALMKLLMKVNTQLLIPFLILLSLSLRISFSQFYKMAFQIHRDLLLWFLIFSTNIHLFSLFRCFFFLSHNVIVAQICQAENTFIFRFIKELLCFDKINFFLYILNAFYEKLRKINVCLLFSLL